MHCPDLYFTLKKTNPNNQKAQKTAVVISFLTEIKESFQDQLFSLHFWLHLNTNWKYAPSGLGCGPDM